MTLRNFCTTSTALHFLNAVRAVSVLATLCSMMICARAKYLLALDSFRVAASVASDSISQLRFLNISAWRPTLMMRSETSSHLLVIVHIICNRHSNSFLSRRTRGAIVATIAAVTIAIVMCLPYDILLVHRQLLGLKGDFWKLFP